MTHLSLHRRHFARAVFFLSVLVTIVSGCSKDSALLNSNPTGANKAHEDNKGIDKIDHVIVIYMENHSFDNLYGEFPGANGLSDATRLQYTQIDTGTGVPYATLPWSDASFVPTPVLPNAPFEIGALRPPSQTTRDLVHRYYQEQNQIDGGKMDKFAAISDAAGALVFPVRGSSNRDNASRAAPTVLES